MIRCFRNIYGATLAILLVAFCCSNLAAQTNADSSVEQRLQQLQDTLNKQQKQINQLQKENQELKQTQQQEPSVSPVSVNSDSDQPKIVPAVYGAEAAQERHDAPKHEGPSVIPAIAPVRVLPLEPPKVGGLVPAFKAGPVSITPYGFIKATAVYDSSNPNGDDFPFVGLFLNTPQVTNAGSNGSPLFHIKARSTRFGTNFEWPDLSKKVAVTGRIEGDFEGNFSEVDNRDVSSIRSNSPQLRLAYGRIDYRASDKTDLFFKAGQDWTLFGSNTMANLLETTFFGAFYGQIYERSPQFTVGWVQDLGGSVKILPEFGIMMPSSGQILKLANPAVTGASGLAGQLGEGEIEGADSARPEIEGRFVVQFQLDHAKGVAPAQITLSGFQGRRQSNAYTTPVPGQTVAPAIAAAIAPGGQYAAGFTSSSDSYGYQLGVQLPTRWVTLIGSIYQGGDLRFYFGGQVNSYGTDFTGLTSPTVFEDQSGNLSAAGVPALAVNSKGQVVVAPEKPIRSFGGIVQAGFPFSRWFNANPKGRNAGWQGYITFGKDQVNAHDLALYNGLIASSPLSTGALTLRMGKLSAASLYYKLNNFVQFGFEQSIYATRLINGLVYQIGSFSNGQPRFSNLWQDHRTEFGPIFTF